MKNHQVQSTREQVASFRIFCHETNNMLADTYLANSILSPPHRTWPSSNSGRETGLDLLTATRARHPTHPLGQFAGSELISLNSSQSRYGAIAFQVSSPPSDGFRDP